METKTSQPRTVENNEWGGAVNDDGSSDEINTVSDINDENNTAGDDNEEKNTAADDEEKEWRQSTVSSPETRDEPMAINWIVDDENKEENLTQPNSLVNTTKLFVHSSWLAVHSTYFKALFFSGMKETHSKEVVMKIFQSELQAHLILVEAMYKLNVLDDKECNLVVQVLALADKYDVDLVFKKCKYVLISSSLSLEKCEDILKIVSNIQNCTEVTEVLDAVEKCLVKEFSPLDKTWCMEKFLGLSKASLKLLLGSDKLVVQSENTVFIALMEWCDSNMVMYRWTVDDEHSLLSLVRFELMDVNFMYDVVRHHRTAKRIGGLSEFLQNGFAYHAFPPSRLEDLKVKPVKRCSYHDDDPTFSWVIDQDEQRRLLTFGATHSSCFWAMGYQMRLKLAYEETTNRYSIFLFVLNIPKSEAHVEISWRAKSNLFQERNVYGLQVQHRFTGSSTGYGRRYLDRNISPSLEPNTLSHTIDAWVDFE